MSAVPFGDDVVDNDDVFIFFDDDVFYDDVFDDDVLMTKMRQRLLKR